MRSNNKICCIYNYAQHYRLPIFQLLNDRLGVHFYFGKNSSDIKGFNYNLLSNFERELEPIYLIKPFYWLKGSLSPKLRSYTHFIVLGEYFCLSTWALLILNKIAGKKTYLWSHGYYGNEGYFKKRIKRLFFSLGTSNLLYGEYARNLMIKDGINDHKLEVIYNSLDFVKQSRIFSDLKSSTLLKDHFKNSNKTLIYIGRLQHRKKISMILQAISIMKDQDQEYNLVLVGEGESRAELEELAVELDINEQVWFFGHLYDEEKIGQLLFDSDLCVSPGNVGLTAMHSLVYGTPIITHGNFQNQMPEFESIISGKSGDFFEENNIQNLVLKVVQWLENHTDRDVVRKDCRKSIESKYNPEYQFKIIKQIIDENSN